EVKRTFKPEFLNRIDDTIVFHPLERSDLQRIVEIELASVSSRLKEQSLALEVTQEAKDFLIEKGFDPVFGARPLKRVIQRYIEDSLASDIISKKFSEGQVVKVVRKNEELVFE
ncbi:MAG: ATP-dependent Clp protease ATP-binding subunit ClpC, partial [Candidatus Omnitrophica bacterium]|nr:ATP-dependent Clp protease ATP-binding subunit ClpC [Candidatus Omnitrophota bacterium]